MNNLGTVLKEKRLSLKMSQKEVADGICTQPMISSIEKNKYIPNSQILISICKKLKINLNILNLDDNYQISSVEKFNKKVGLYCNNHEYQKLKKFLLQESTVSMIENDQQTQAYYYYLGVCHLQADKDLKAAKMDLQMAMSKIDNQRELTTLDRLTLISMSLIFANKNIEYESKKYLKLAFTDLDKSQFETNQIALFYLAAYTNILLGENIDATNWIVQGIEFASAHDSHYMLGNMYYLLARLASNAHKNGIANIYQSRANIFVELFNEKIFKSY
ncbi:helix-turn-helix domain-containing protein [Companilactobacillus sp. HBUAS59699]|uniref:helix-turn-helix domain-containing protein n=1 Tax=Companilactobacillus sp. HBUAS59699 TaxID=3109358 RepID=UPI002FF2A9B3